MKPWTMPTADSPAATRSHGRYDAPSAGESGDGMPGPAENMCVHPSEGAAYPPAGGEAARTASGPYRSA